MSKPTRQKKIMKNLYRQARRGDFKGKAILFPREIENLKNLGLSISKIKIIATSDKIMYKVIIDWSSPYSDLTHELFNIAVDNS